MEDYDKQVEKIRNYNDPILLAFETSLEEAGLSEKTVGNHVYNIDFFTEYLISYEPLKTIDEADERDVNDFLLDWFPRKAMWANVTNAKSYISSFRKFFKWMHSEGRIKKETLKDILEDLKEHKDEFLDAVDDEDTDWL